MNPLLEAKRLGQSIWLDNLSRTLLQEGGIAALQPLDWIEKDTQTRKRRAGRVVF